MVSQVKFKRCKYISFNEALSAYLLLFNQIIQSFLSLSLGMIVLLLVTLPTDPLYNYRLFKKRPNLFFYILFFPIIIL